MLKVRRRRVAVEQPRVGGAAEEAGVLARPGQVAVVGRLLRQRDRRRQTGLAGTHALDQRAEARPIVRLAGLGVLDADRLVRIRRSSCSSRSRSARCRWSPSPAARRSCRDAGRCAASIRRPACRGRCDWIGRKSPRTSAGAVGLGVPRLVLRRPAQEAEHDARLRPPRPPFASPRARIRATSATSTPASPPRRRATTRAA